MGAAGFGTGDIFRGSCQAASVLAGSGSEDWRKTARRALARMGSNEAALHRYLLAGVAIDEAETPHSRPPRAHISPPQPPN